MITKILLSIIPVSAVMLINTATVNLAIEKPKSRPDTLTQFGFSATRMKECTGTPAVKQLSSRAQQLKSCAIVYQAGDKWILDTNDETRAALINSYPVKKIAICSGNVKINGKGIAQRNLVILRNTD